MKNRFDLEQEIMDCWGVVDDLNIVYETRGDKDDELANVLLGLKTLYQLKFERLFSTFENCVSQRQLEGGNPYKDLYTDIVSDGGMDPRGPYEEERRKGKEV